MITLDLSVNVRNVQTRHPSNPLPSLCLLNEDWGGLWAQPVEFLHWLVDFEAFWFVVVAELHWFVDGQY